MHMHDGIGIRQFLEDPLKKLPPVGIRKTLKVMKFSDDLRKSADYLRRGRIEHRPLIVLDVNFEQDVWFGIALVVPLDKRREALAIVPGFGRNPFFRKNQA